VVIDSQGNIFITDNGNHRIQKFDKFGNFVLAFGDSGTGDGQFQYPRGIGVDSQDNIYVAGNLKNDVQKFDNNGNFLLEWGQAGTQPGKFSFPKGLTVDSNDYIYVADEDNDRIQKFTSTGSFVLEWGETGTLEGAFLNPIDVAVDSLDNVYVTDLFNQRVQKFTSTGAFLATWGTGPLSGNGQFNLPTGVAVDPCGQIFIGDRNNFRAQKFGEVGTSCFNTPIGNDVVIFLAGTELTFQQVSEQGETELQLQGSGPTPPNGLQFVPSSPPMYYDFTTTAVIGGEITLGISYDPADVLGDEADLVLLHWDDTLTIPSWRNLTTSVNTQTKTVYGSSSTLSLFVLLEPGSPSAVANGLPAAYRLLPASPNPFRSRTTIRYELPEASPVRIQMFDLEGRLVDTLLDDPQRPAGRHEIVWGGRNASGQEVAPGMYFYRMSTRTGEFTQKVLFVR